MVNEAGRARVKRAVEAEMISQGITNVELARLCGGRPDAGSIGEFRHTERWFGTRNLMKIEQALGWADGHIVALLNNEEPPSTKSAEDMSDDADMAALEDMLDNARRLTPLQRELIRAIIRAGEDQS